MSDARLTSAIAVRVRLETAIYALGEAAKEAAFACCDDLREGAVASAIMRSTKIHAVKADLERMLMDLNKAENLPL